MTVGELIESLNKLIDSGECTKDSKVFFIDTDYMLTVPNPVVEKNGDLKGTVIL